MKKILVSLSLLVLALLAGYGAWFWWERLSKPAILLAGLAIGACVSVALSLLVRRSARDDTRQDSHLPSPWERMRWL